MMLAAPDVLLPTMLLSGGGYAGLRHSGYESGSAALLMLLLGGQAGILVAIALPGHSLWLAAGVAGLAASCAAFAAREDVRRLILFGAALAAIQLCDPMGALLAAGMLPAAVSIGGRHYDGREAVGLYALLLFLPVLTAATLLYLGPVRAAGLLQPPGSWLAVGTPISLPARLAVAAAPIVIAAPALALVWGKKPGRAIAFVSAAFLFAGLVAAWRGAIREPVTLLAAAAPLTGAAVAALPEGPWRSGQAIVTCASCLGLSWAVLILVWR